jgi:hypothetical protein
MKTRGVHLQYSFQPRPARCRGAEPLVRPAVGIAPSMARSSMRPGPWGVVPPCLGLVQALGDGARRIAGALGAGPAGAADGLCRAAAVGRDAGTGAPGAAHRGACAPSSSACWPRRSTARSRCWRCMPATTWRCRCCATWPAPASTTAAHRAAFCRQHGRAAGAGRGPLHGGRLPRAAAGRQPQCLARGLKPLLKPGQHKLIGCMQRTQGLMVAKGNPLRCARWPTWRTRRALRQPPGRLGHAAADRPPAGQQKVDGAAHPALLRQRSEDSHIAVAAAVASGVGRRSDGHRGRGAQASGWTSCR